VPDRYLVRCTAAAGWAMSGIYCASLPASGMVATWKEERAKRYDSQAEATRAALCLGKRFTGTVWTPELARGVQ